MLIYEHDGFVEAETKEIQQLCRSPFTVSFGNQDQGKYELHASLCHYLDKEEQRCRIAFYDKSLKKSLVFTVAGTDKKSLWKYGQEILRELGFQLEDVNLKLSPAMLEVVLRDVPGITSPAEAQRQRTEHQRLLAELQATKDDKPESAQGKRAALKLSTEKRIESRAGTLREILEDLFSPEEPADDENATLLAQIKDLAARLEEAESIAAAERSAKEISEAITTAAEKRIQELEEILVDVETQSSDALKQKRKTVALNKRIKELDAELLAAQETLLEEQVKQKQFVDDVKTANEQITELQKELKESEDLREEAFAQLGEQESEATQLDKSCKEAELRIKVLDQELKAAEQKAGSVSDAVKRADELQVQLDQMEVELNETINLKENLKEELAAAVQQQEALQKSLEEAQQADKVEPSAQQALEDKYAEVVNSNESLREELDQERSVRRRLERGAAEDDRRISELEKSLEQAEAAHEKVRSERQGDEPGSSAVLEKEIETLTLHLDQEKAAQETLNKELQESHKIIDSLEKMVRETEAGSSGKSKPEVSATQDDGRVQELEERLRALEDQLEGEVLVKKTLAKELASVEKKLAEQEDSLTEASTVKRETSVVEAAVPTEAEKVSKPSKPLPHEVRPAPKKGAFFRPDWDLQGLPCRSTGEIIKAWETVFNVQMAIEGYPSQYCMAFMAILKQGKQKKLYLLYRLKQNKHTLVCVPTKKLKDNAGLQKAVKEGLDFLRKSGFEMDEMSEEHIESTLGTYCLESV